MGSPGHLGPFPASQVPVVAEAGGRGGGAVLLLPGLRHHHHHPRLGARALAHALGRPRQVEDGVDLAGGVRQQTHGLEIACKGTGDGGREGQIEDLTGRGRQNNSLR